MATEMRDNKDVACYFITKHSWKGKYKRIFSVGTKGITTYNPNMEVTNQWPYSEFVGIAPNTKTLSNEFIITMKKGAKKTETMRFSTDHRADLLTEALRFRNSFAERNTSTRRFNAYKYHWSSNRIPVLLEVNQGSLDQICSSTGRLLASYDYKDLEGLSAVSDYPGGLAVIYGGFSRLHLFALEGREELVKCIQEAAGAYIGIPIKQRKDPITMDMFQQHRLGKYSTDEALTSYVEFTVQKVSPRHPENVRRTLCLTETCLVERDPGTYNIATLRPLCDIFAIVRDQRNPQQFSVEYVKGTIRTYTSTDRDALIASLLDGVRASGNRDVHVKMCFTNRGHRLGPFTVPVDEEVESQHMKFIQAPPSGMTFAEAVSRFNSNISYSGLLHAVTADAFFAENKEKLINGTLGALLEKEGDQQNITAIELEAQFHALRRLVASKAGFQAFTHLPKMREKVGMKVVKALKRNDDGVTHSAIDMICALMQPMHDDYEIRQEQLNKASIMSSKKFLESLMETFKNHVIRGTGALVITAMLDFLTFALCAPYSETTDGNYFDILLEMVAAEGRYIFKLFQHPSMAIVKGAGMVMKAVIEEGEPEVAAKMQDLALAEGALPRHLHTAMFTQSTDSRMLTVRQLSRHLVGLWVTGHPTAMALLKRIMPSGLLAYLDSDADVPEEEEDRLHVRDNLKLAQEHENRKRKHEKWKQVEKQVEVFLTHWRGRIGEHVQRHTGLDIVGKPQQNEPKPIVLRKRRQRIKSEANWLLFYYYFARDHARPNLIWNFKTREELRSTLEEEIRAFNVDKDLGNNYMISWNHQEFEVTYSSLADEIKIGDYYLRLLLEEDDSENDEYSGIKRSYEFFNDLYHRFLLSSKVKMKCMCLQAMAIVYGRCHEEIGAFNDTRYIVGMLERCSDRLERDRLVFFLNKLILNKRNVKDIMDANGIRTLTDLLTLAHLHTSRATVPMQTNVIEASPDMMRHSEKEWYFGNADKERLGPYSFEEMKEYWDDGVLNPKTRCWAQGMDGWRPLHTIPQLKWCLMASGSAVMNETDLATLILNMLIKMCEYYPSRDVDGAIVRPLPRIKRLLSESTCLPHTVQLLLTFDPVLVEKVATVLYLVMLDNPTLPRLYLTGVFYFIQMYTGSNVLPIVRFLKYTHLKQAFRAEENNTSDIMQRSILGPILPEAMVCYLENYDAEKFAQIFLGEFDTPEAIWSAEMRRMMIEKIASHLADFSPRLQSNTRALYQYCPIPIIGYPQLENELFCNIYYLRHLCDTLKFPDWPIKEPVKLLKDILEAWTAEVEKKPPTMSIDDALEVLGMPKGTPALDETKIRKAYFRLAQKYHPDRNPEGRDMFEQVNKAYEFLCSKSKITEGPDPKNIVLILKAQSILLSRYREVLEPYKYAGYPMLIKTIRMETKDDQLFSKAAPLLSAASELAYHTVACSALNAEELRRENGIETLQEAFSRCVSVLSHSSKPEDVAVQVCTHISHCYGVASQFEGCRERIQETQAIVKDLCRILYFKNLVAPAENCCDPNVASLCTVVVECVSAFCVDFWLQTHLHQCGVLWHLLLFLFNYDYTLEESGVEKSEKNNQQEVANQLAKLSVYACARLGGYLTGDLATPDNPAVTKSLNAMLTPYLARKLSENNPSEEVVNPILMSGTHTCVVIVGDCGYWFYGRTWLHTLYPAKYSAAHLFFENKEVILKILNSNTENPYLIWDNATRAELGEFLGDQQQQKIRTGECDPGFGSDFVFSVHKEELIVGEIFVRVYNEQPTFPLENAKGFTIDLLDYLGSQAQYLHSLMALNQQAVKAQMASSNRLHNVEMALEALRNVIRNNPGRMSPDESGDAKGQGDDTSSPGVEIQCIGHFKLMFSLLRVEGCAKIQEYSLEVISSVTGNAECVSDIAASEVLQYLLLIIEMLPACRSLLLETLYPLTSNTKLLKEALNKGALIYLLDLYCNATNPTVREQTADLLAKILTDKLVGPKVRIILSKFLPPIFMDAMRDNAASSVHMFEGVHENPELIWNDDAREKVCAVVKRMKDAHFANQKENGEVKWNIPDDFGTVYEMMQNDVVVGGVFLRIYIAHPKWTLRRPKEFITELLEKWAEIIQSVNSINNDLLELVTTAIVYFFAAQPIMLEQVPQLGHIPKLFAALQSRNNAIPHSAIRIVHQMVNSDVCIRAIASIECILPIKVAMKIRSDSIGLASETLNKMFKSNEETLIDQALSCEMVDFMIKLLDKGLEQLDKPSATKAQIVQALKSMQANLRRGEEVRVILEKYPVWREYRDQDESLFIDDRPTMAALTGPATAGYLTSGTTQNSLSSVPPPMDRGVAE